MDKKEIIPINSCDWGTSPSSLDFRFLASDGSSVRPSSSGLAKRCRSKLSSIGSLRRAVRLIEKRDSWGFTNI